MPDDEQSQNNGDQIDESNEPFQGEPSDQEPFQGTPGSTPNPEE